MAKESRERYFPCHGLLVPLGGVDRVVDRVREIQLKISSVKWD